MKTIHFQLSDQMEIIHFQFSDQKKMDQSHSWKPLLQFEANKQN